ncbi:MAG: long-chain-fatty-acid--CoA ligase [Hyphomonadaceae bacterium]|nr:long-chain-fatty-acid--CoA ligase [Hyphomonadaceae bacterium]
MLDLDRLHSLADITRIHAADRGDHVAVQFEGRTTTYGALDRRASQVAQALIAEGVAPGARAATLMKNSDLFYEALFGALKARACLAPINFRLAPAEVGYILADAEPDVLFVGSEFLETAAAALAGMQRRARMIVIDTDDYVAWRDAAPAVDPKLAAEPSDDVLQLYTSGTTGMPKGVCLSNRNYRTFFELSVSVEGFDYRAEETVLIVMPLFHVAGTNISFAGLANGSRVIVMKEFNPPALLALIAAERVSHVFLAPAMIQFLLQQPAIDDTDFSSLRTIAYGASPIAEEVLRRAQAAFKCGFVQFYGMTETTGAGTYLKPSEHEGSGKLRSCGKGWGGMEVKVVDAAGAALAAREVGEILIRGGTIMERYWRQPEATAKAVTDGWMRTGDAGFFDEEGFLYVHDRVKDMIVTGGENVYPAEVENAIFGCPGVLEVAIIGVPSAQWGEEVKAMIVADPKAPPTKDAIVAWARERIAGYKLPKSVDFIETLPRNASGKVLRRQLREPFWEGRDRAVG